LIRGTANSVETPLAAFLPSFLHRDHASRKPGLISTGRAFSGRPGFDTARDFVPVSLLARFEFGIVIGPGVEAKDFSQFVAWLKAHPDQAIYGVPSNGTIPHFAGTRLEKAPGVAMTRVPYLSRQRAYCDRPHRRPSAVRHRARTRWRSIVPAA
jgi:hypothetical protein